MPDDNTYCHTAKRTHVFNNGSPLHNDSVKLNDLDLLSFHQLANTMKYGGGDLTYPCFHRVTSLRFTK